MAERSLSPSVTATGSAAAALLILTGCGLLDGAQDDESGPGFNVAAPIRCDVPQCGEFFLSPEGPPLPGLRFERQTLSDLRVQLRADFAQREEATVMLSRLVLTALGEDPSTDQWTPILKRAALDRSTAEWLAGRLDDVAPGWRQVSAPILPRAPTPILEQALEVSGCGAMQLTMSLDAVTVHERDDNTAGDRIYCVVQAKDDSHVEVTSTEISPNLGPNQTHFFRDPIFYGREAGRDPGSGLSITYDCWEHDSPADYENMKKVLSALARLGKAIPSQAGAALISIVKVGQVVVELAAILDGDDHLYRAREDLRRQGLWSLMMASPRALSDGGTNNFSDWSWSLEIGASGCAEPWGGSGNGGNGGGGNEGGDIDNGGGGSPPPAPEPCGPRSCDGCCVGEQCLQGITDGACGSGGADCRSCGGVESCQRGFCQFDSTARFDVEAVSAEVGGSGCDWDADCSAPDLYLSVGINGNWARTRKIESLSPQWDQVVHTSVSAEALMRRVDLDLVDDDLAVDDDAGGCWFQAEVSDLAASEVALYDCGGANIYLGFRRR